MLRQYLETGRVVGTHGVKDKLRIRPWCDSMESLPQFRTLYWDPNGISVVKVLPGRVHRRLFLAALEGVTSATQGDTLRRRVLYLGRMDVRLPKGTWSAQDLLGSTVLDVDTGKEYDKLTNVLKADASDVCQVTSPEGKTYLVSPTLWVVLERNPEGGAVKIRPIKGISDSED